MWNNKFNSENNNINYSMKKYIQRNYNRLESKVNKITNPISKGLGKEILDLYSSRKVSQFVNAERIIDSLKKRR